MRHSFPAIALLFGLLAIGQAKASQADETIITIEAKEAGPNPFIEQLTLQASDASVIKSVQFTIEPKSGSVTRALSGSYDMGYLADRGFLQLDSGQIFLPVYGLYEHYTNTVVLTYRFLDGSSKTDSTDIATAHFEDPCTYDSPTVLQARTDSTALSYDYMMIKGSCSDFSPALLDTDGALRWVGPGGFDVAHSAFFDNAIYIAQNQSLYRIDLDGTVTFLHSYADLGVTAFHHNIDPGKSGLILEVNTTDHKESLDLEVDVAGNVVKMWDLADIVSAAMIAGGDDPTQFVMPSSSDWFHNNAVAYNRADDSLIISSRENFVICLDYDTLAIKWILGDETKKWFQFPSLAKYSLATAAGTLPPIGQHAVSLTYDLGVLVFDNGKPSVVQMPPGQLRPYSSARKYQIDQSTKIATEVWNYEMDQSVYSSICSSVYEDAPLNYLVDYAYADAPAGSLHYAQLLGLDAAGNKIFHYQYPATFCQTAFNAFPVHLEDTSFPAVEAQALNLSTRGFAGASQDTLIGGFIITGASPATLVLRALGPSLADTGVTGTLADPVLNVFDSAGKLIASNDDWGDDPQSAQLLANHLAPEDPSEAATLLTLDPGAYTALVSGGDNGTGIGLVEVYNLSPGTGGRLANISTRGSVGGDDDVLIGGFIVGEVAKGSFLIRALGPSLGAAGVVQPLDDPTLTVYDANGSETGANDDWQEDSHSDSIQAIGLAPSDDRESATVLYLPAGAYSAVVSGATGEQGVGLVEVYNLD